MRTLILIFLSFGLHACKKTDQTAQLPLPASISRSIGPEGGEVHFYEDADLIQREKPMLSLSFPAESVSKKTSLELYRIAHTDLNLGRYLPVSDVYFFGPKQVQFAKEARVTMNYKVLTPQDNIYDDQKTFQGGFLYGRSHMLKLYEITYNRGLPFELSKELNWKESSNYKLDTVNGQITFNILSLEKAYCLAFPEMERNDTFILKSSYKPLNITSIEKGFQTRVTQGFMALENLNYMNFTTSGDTVMLIYLNYKGMGKGIFPASAIDLFIRGYYWDFTLNPPDIFGLGSFVKGANMQLQIYMYGDIGQRIQGRLTGNITADFGGVNWPLDLYFSVIRTR
jgi:hypothetical protein